MIDNTVYLASDSIFVDYVADEDKEMKEIYDDMVADDEISRQKNYD